MLIGRVVLCRRKTVKVPFSTVNNLYLVAFFQFLHFFQCYCCFVPHLQLATSFLYIMVLVRYLLLPQSVL